MSCKHKNNHICRNFEERSKFLYPRPPAVSFVTSKSSELVTWSDYVAPSKLLEHSIPFDKKNAKLVFRTKVLTCPLTPTPDMQPSLMSVPWCTPVCDKGRLTLLC